MTILNVVTTLGNRVLTIPEIAQEMGVNNSSVDNWIRRGLDLQVFKVHRPAKGSGVGKGSAGRPANKYSATAKGHRFAEKGAIPGVTLRNKGQAVAKAAKAVRAPAAKVKPAAATKAPAKARPTMALVPSGPSPAETQLAFKVIQAQFAAIQQTLTDAFTGRPVAKPAAKAKGPAKAKAAATPSNGKRGPGRPRGSKNKPKMALRMVDTTAEAQETSQVPMDLSNLPETYAEEAARLEALEAELAQSREDSDSQEEYSPMASMG